MILETIAVVQTANVAIGAIKELIGNGKDLTDCGKELTTYFTAKSKIQLNASSSGSGDDLKLFLSLDKLKQQEYELKQLMIYTGRSGMWDDWIRFQNSQKKQRDNDKQQIALKKVDSARDLEELYKKLVLVRDNRFEEPSSITNNKVLSLAKWYWGKKIDSKLYQRRKSEFKLDREV